MEGMLVGACDGGGTWTEPEEGGKPFTVPSSSKANPQMQATCNETKDLKSHDIEPSMIPGIGEEPRSVLGKAQSRGVQPAARRLHAAWDGCECGPT